LGDPPTCSSSTGGIYSHVYVTISDVKIHQSSSAGPNDSGWVDLTPTLASAPQQVDLLALGGNNCFLATLGSTTEIPAGTYQQIRIILAPNSATVANNQCGNSANCVVANGGQPVAMNLSSESQTGIKIPSGQLAGGNFTIAAGEVRDLVIDFDACSSLVVQGNGQVRLKPVLHAGEVSTVGSSITGQLVDSATNAAIAGTVKSIVALEAPDANGVNRMVMQIAPDANGNFVFCPVPTGTFNLIAVTQSTNGGTTTAYSATILTGVQAGNAVGKIPMHAQVTPNTQQGMITGTVSTAGASAGIAEDITISALQTLLIGSSNTQFTVPLAQQQSSTLSVTTASGSSCSPNTDCTTYTIALPASLPYVGAFSTSISYAQATGSGSAIPYTVDAMSVTPGSSSTATCSPSELTTSVQQDGTTALAVTSGTTVTAKTLAFTGCQ
jgi:hypothetical protein